MTERNFFGRIKINCRFVKTVGLKNDIICLVVFEVVTEKLNKESCHVYVHRH